MGFREDEDRGDIEDNQACHDDRLGLPIIEEEEGESGLETPTQRPFFMSGKSRESPAAAGYGFLISPLEEEERCSSRMGNGSHMGGSGCKYPTSFF